MPDRLIQRHDEFAKCILDEPGNADAFVRERLPPEVVERLSQKPAMDRSESHVPPELRDLRGDGVYSLETADGDEVLVWTLVEHKRSPDADVLVKLLTDLAGIAAKGASKRKGSDGRIRHIPAAVYPVILYHGPEAWPHPTRLADAYDLPPDLATHGLISFVYTLVSLLAIPDHLLSSNPALRAALMVLKYAAYDDDPERTVERLVEAAVQFGLTTAIVVVRYLIKESSWVDPAYARRLVARLMPSAEEQIMTPALKQIIDAERPRIIAEERPRIIAEERPKIIDAERPRIIDEERPKLLAETVLHLLRRKFGALSNEVTQQVRSADLDRLTRMTDRLLDANALDDVLNA